MTALTNLFRSWTFRWAILYLLISVTASGAVVSYLFWQTNDLLAVQLLQTLSSEEKGLREQYALGGIGLLRETVRERARAPGAGIYLLTDANGRKIAGNLNRVPPELLENRGGLFTFDRQGLDGAKVERLAVGRIIRVRRGALLVVARDIQEQRDFALTSQRILLWGVAVVALIGLGGGVLVSRYIFRRIDAVTETSRRIVDGNLSERIPVNGSGDEIDRLSTNLNDMLARIEDLMTGMREVSDNIAHDLKTPLNRLRNRVEGALRADGDKQSYRATLEATIDEADALIRTFNALLSVARLEAGARSVSSETLSIATVVDEVAELYAPVFEEAGRELRVRNHLVMPAMIDGDRQLIGQALTNLVENALKYGHSVHAPAVRGAGGGESEKFETELIEVGTLSPARAAIHDVTIELGESATCDGVTVVVGDRGPGVPPDERERVKKRFVRLEESRSRPGSGLGLSVVAAVMRLHGGELVLSDNRPGLRATMRFPRASEGADAVLDRSP
ncbi:MAG: ATP-binding protein [Pseudomonadota bacterium]